MQVYIYSYKSDASDEPIGRVTAMRLSEARRKISIIKQLDIGQIDHLFNIQKIDDHEQPNRKDSN
tara:strand:- start:139 stop:333 length:195 start_codon:yes stop_codon:yes gene_type:complete